MAFVQKKKKKRRRKKNIVVVQNSASSCKPATHTRGYRNLAVQRNVEVVLLCSQECQFKVQITDIVIRYNQIWI
jgi:hypothetical protein